MRKSYYFSGIIIGIVVSSAVVLAWSNPTSAPPQGNVFAPINVGPAMQTKTGGVTIEGILTASSTMLVNSTTTLARLRGYVGIATTSPQALLDVGGKLTYANSVIGGTLSGIPIAMFSSNLNSYSGIEMRNTNTETSADFRLVISDTSGHYLAFAVPGLNNSGILLGQVRSSSDFIFNNTGTTRNLTIGSVSAKDLIFGTNNTENVRIKSSGNVGIGTATPGTKLSVYGLTSSQAGRTVCSDATGNFYYYAGACVASSATNKENIIDLEDQSDQIFLLRPVRFDYKDTGQEDIGLIAEEVASVMPDLVYYNNDEISGVKYDKLSVFLLQAVKKISARINRFEQAMMKLTDRVTSVDYAWLRGVEFIDQVTGELYCVSMNNGALLSARGPCQSH